QPFDAHGAHDSTETVACTDLMVGSRAATEPFDLLRGHDSTVARVPLRLDAPLAVPAPQRVEADPERPGGLTCAVVVLRHTTVLLASSRTNQRARAGNESPVGP